MKIVRSVQNIMSHRANVRLHLTLLLLIFCLLAASYIVVIPFFEGPDEDAHVTYLAYIQNTRSLPRLNAESAAISHEMVQQPPLYYILATMVNWGQDISSARQFDRRNPYLELGLSKRHTISLSDANFQYAIPLYLARVVALIGGLLTVWGAWQLTDLLLPRESLAALAVASIVGLNPQFLFSSATVTNDTWAAALFVWSIYLVHWACQTEKKIWWWFAGLGIGFATLTKYSDLMVIIPVAFLCLEFYFIKATSFRIWVYRFLLLAFGFLSTAGFWYFRNLLTTGSLMPMQRILDLLPGLTRVTPLSFTSPTFWGEAQWLFRSYWGVFGYGLVAPLEYHWFIQCLLWIALFGMFLLLLRAYLTKVSRQDSNSAIPKFYTWLNDPSSNDWWRTLALALVWLVPLVFSLLNWIRIVQFGNQGRLLFPAAPAVALILIIGWQAWLPVHWRPWLYRIVPICFVGLATSQLYTLYQYYRLPPTLEMPVSYQRPINAHFAGGMIVLGVDLPKGAALSSGGELPITIYFTTEQPIDDFYTLFIHLADKQNHLLYQFDGVPVKGRHPTAQWNPGAVFADTYLLKSPDKLTDSLASLSLGFYRFDDPNNRQHLLDNNGTSLTDRLVVAPIRLHETAASKPMLESTSLAQWVNGIDLQRVEIESDSVGNPQRLNLRWISTKVLQTDYTVFAQLLDKKGKLLAQVDQIPQKGEYPTSTWQAGDQIDDSYLFPSFNDKWSRLIIGFYDQQGVRLKLQSPNSDSDFFVVAQNKDNS